jgi:hypothetical protein
MWLAVEKFVLAPWFDWLIFVSVLVVVVTPHFLGKNNLHCHRWGPLLAVPTHLLLAEEWGELFRMAGFTDVAHERVVDPSPSPEVYTGRWFRDAAQLREFKAQGALLIHGRKG